MEIPDRTKAWREALVKVKADGHLVRTNGSIDDVLSPKRGVITKALERPTAAAKPDLTRMTPEQRQHQRDLEELERRRAAKAANAGGSVQ